MNLEMAGYHLYVFLALDLANMDFITTLYGHML